MEVRDVAEVEIYLEKSIELTLLFDSGHALEERILREQFSV
jgi:NAD+ kinase